MAILLQMFLNPSQLQEELCVAKKVTHQNSRAKISWKDFKISWKNVEHSYVHVGHVVIHRIAFHYTDDHDFFGLLSSFWSR